MNYIIFDLEWNQPVNSEKSDKLPHGEIIQTGFLVLDESFEITHRAEIMIKPVIYRTMNPYVSTLTGIKQSDINAGIPFREAFSGMAKFFGRDTALITWGDDDMPILRENMRFHAMEEIPLPSHYNLQRIFASQTESHLRQTGLKTALEALGITDEIKAHDALNDAYMTYLIAKKLDMRLGIEKYDVFAEEVNAKRPPWETDKPLFTAKAAYSKNPSALSSEIRRLHYCCPWCGTDFCGTEPIRQGKTSFVGSAECADLGVLFFRYTLKDDYLRVSAFQMTDELSMVYQSRIKSREKRDKRRELFRRTAAEKRRKKKEQND
jgi:inhibitor of KinA sporulation pathway (predicted exonuclease)